MIINYQQLNIIYLILKIKHKPVKYLVVLNELVNNVKDVLDEIPIHIYKNLIKGAYDRSEKYVKRPSTRKRKPKKYLD